MNEEKQEPDKYYLPSKVNGKHIQWAYPTDHSGMILMSLAILAGILLILLKERRRAQELEKRKEQKRARKMKNSWYVFIGRRPSGSSKNETK